MATVVYSNEEDGMCSFVIDGEEYIEDEERAIIPKAVLKQIKVDDIPDNFEIVVCESKDSSVIMVSVPMSFVKVGKNEFQVIYDELITRKYWDGPIGLKLYMETKKDVIEERSKEIGDVWLENYDDDGAYIHLVYSTKICADILLIDKLRMDADRENPGFLCSIGPWDGIRILNRFFEMVRSREEK